MWLGLNGTVGKIALDHMAFLFTMYAQGVLPLLMPLAVLLMEPPGRCRRAMVLLTCIGAMAAVWDAVGLIAYPSRTFVQCHSIAYRNPLTGNLFISCLYVLAMCGSLLLSSHRVIRLYTLLNVIGLTITQLVREFAFASVWCFYAATLSVIIYWQFRRGSIVVDTPHGPTPSVKPFLFPLLHRTNSAV